MLYLRTVLGGEVSTALKLAHADEKIIETAQNLVYHLDHNPTERAEFTKMLESGRDVYITITLATTGPCR
jgi:hypothetical protein